MQPPWQGQSTWHCRPSVIVTRWDARRARDSKRPLPTKSFAIGFPQSWENAVKQTTYTAAIHDILTLRIRDRIGLAERAFTRPMRGYVHHRVDLPDGVEPDMEVHIGPFDFQDRGFTRVDRRFHVDHDYFACEDTYKVLWWKVEMWDFEAGRPRMRVHANWFGTAALGSRLIDCMVRFQLAQRKAPAIHCCGVVGDDGAYLLSGRSGVGKSTLAMRLLGEGYRLLGDNWVIARGGEALSFHLPVNVHSYNVAPQMYARMPRRLRLELWTLTAARRLTGGFLKKATPVVLADVFPDYVAERAPLRKVLTFSQGEQLAIRPLDRTAGVRRLVANDLMDREAFYRYMLAYATVHRDGPMACHWRRLGERLLHAIPEDVPFLDIVVPRRLDAAVVSEIRRALDG